METLVSLFKTSDEKSSWVRVPVINYLRACPKPEAEGYLKELEKIDPAAVKRANTFFPFTPSKSTEDPPKTSSSEPQEESVKTASLPVTPPASATKGELAAVDVPAADIQTASKIPSDEKVNRPNRIVFVGVTWVSGLILMLVQWTILGGIGHPKE
jgi:hypothetical protein